MLLDNSNISNVGSMYIFHFTVGGNLTSNPSQMLPIDYYTGGTQQIEYAIRGIHSSFL